MYDSIFLVILSTISLIFSILVYQRESGSDDERRMERRCKKIDRSIISLHKTINEIVNEGPHR